MMLVTYTSLLVTPVVGLLPCIPKYLAETMTLGEVVQASAAFVVIQGAFGWFTDNYAAPCGVGCFGQTRRIVASCAG
jgi:vitamin B12/bleomycin/antimicrobial peptide transport system ATP-binding/permease protein